MNEPLTPEEREEFRDRATRIPWEHCIFIGNEMKRLLDERDALEREVQAQKDQVEAERERVADLFNQRDTLRAQLEKAMIYGRHLLGIIAPECEPLGDPAGIMTQLDNYIAGLRARCEALLEVHKRAAALAEAMATCHICQGVLLVEDGVAHCEDCSYDCDEHAEPACPSIDALHNALQVAINKAGGV